MSEIMRPIPFPALINRALVEYNNCGSVFGIRKEKFFRPAPGGIALLGKKISLPIGPAAGPHSQLAQNIFAAYLSGARFIELKTVQTMDGEELRKCIARPCINAADEGYNVEWSTELTVPEAMDEYVKAWFLCCIFAKEFEIGRITDLIFNMSVGYSLEGIKSDKIDAFIEGLKDAGNTPIWKHCYDYIASNLSLFSHFSKEDLDAISPHVSNNITLSTLHGCPCGEIEKIAAYLITEKSLHTYIKCNPTLLGYKTARSLLDEMGYGYVSFDDHHFKNDLQFDDAVEMLKRLKTLAVKRTLDFGVKITNTFPVQIKRGELPGGEMYMSGRALFPLSINVAKKLSQAFKGKLPISYSGGADFYNLKALIEAGIRPVTAATAILKPGGFERFTQLSALVQDACYNILSPLKGAPIIDVKALNAICKTLPQQKWFRKEYRDVSSNKTSVKVKSVLPLFDCFKAPCMDTGCPIHQRIPDYLAAVAAGNYDEAFRIITIGNTAPSITGTICDHKCQSKCTRINYEDPLQIRRLKLIACDRAQEIYTDSLSAPEIKTKESAAIIGAGPAGIAAAVFLRRNGVPVTVYEKRDQPFGAVQHLIPSFRISDEAISRDFKIAVKTGVEFAFNVSENYSLADLQKSHKFVVIATGAWKEANLHSSSYIDALRFLEDSKKTNCGLDLGKRVAVIGGGDVAMDCARAAKRNKGVKSVSIVYRRTREFMPAQYEERELALADGVIIEELLSPEKYSDGVLTCEVMSLGDYDSSGRRGIIGMGKKRELFFDTVISATGARIDTDQFAFNNIKLEGGFPKTGAGLECSVQDVYIAGDCRKGASTVVNAIADGKTVAASILQKLGIKPDFLTETVCPHQVDFESLYLKKGVISEAKNENVEGCRCLSCNTLCEICADVCPNRANVAVVQPASNNGLERHQILHIDRMCNECGNCATFCPQA
ncbi:MAG: putative selenate reductase subunit YgfK, partial [Treponema sp.]|nr:putative selenate reductase subunit YgfK [Treponema sp.]